MNYLDLLIAMAEFSLAWVLFQQTIPSSEKDGRVCGIRLWLLAMALALFATGRLTSFFENQEGPFIYTFGHFCLIGYSLARYRQAVKMHGKIWASKDRLDTAECPKN
jgi:hypothetical protein